MTTGLAGQALAQPPAKADLVFSNGVVHTVNTAQPSARAVAVTGTTITYVGSDQGALPFIGPSTRVIDLKGRMLLPGFVEGHIHPIMGATATRGIDLQMDTRDEVLAALRHYAGTLSQAEPVRGFGWRYNAFPATGPVKADLDAIWPDTPVMMLAVDGHSAWVNSKALALAGIDRTAADPIPGFSYFKRDPKTGEATGWLIEVPAIVAVLMKSMPLNAEFIVQSLREWMPKASAAGITSVFDAGMQIVPEDVGFDLYNQLADEGALPFRVVGSYYHNNPAIDPVPIIRKLRADHQSELVRASVLKLNMDGVDSGHTAAMLEPYADQPGTRGDTLLSKDLVDRIVQQADAEGIDIHVHSIGDRATRMTLDAIEAAMKVNPPRDRRHTIAHLQGVAPEDLPRFAQLGVIGEFSAQWAVPDKYWKEVTGVRWGEQRSAETYMFGTLLRSGARVTFGTDWPAASNYSTYKPLEAIECAVTRRELGRTDQQPLVPANQRIPLAAAIQANTLDAAYQIRLDHQVGSIAVGKLADLVVLDRNLFELPAHEIHTAKVELTVMNGKVVHDV